LIQEVGTHDSIVARQRHAADFFNSIGQERPFRDVRVTSALPLITDIDQQLFDGRFVPILLQNYFHDQNAQY
jgi:hypothetical protein